MTGPTPPGWYADPYGTPGLQRWWDGAQWTQATQPTDEWDDAPPPAPFVAPGQEVPGYGRQPWSGQGAQQIGWSLPQQQQPQQQQQPPAQQGWTGQPAYQQPDSGGSNKGLMWALAGGGGVVAIGLIVALLFVTGTIGGGGGSSPSPTASAGSSTPLTGGSGQSPVIGTITDTVSGLSYAQLGGKWYLETPSNLATVGFSKGEVAHVQEDYKDPSRSGTSPYYANVYSGLLSTKISYSGDLEAAAKSEFAQLETSNYPRDHTRQDGDSKSYSVSGKKAWYFATVLEYPNAAQYGWNFHSESIVVITVDRGANQRPAVFYVSIPSSHQNLGDLTGAINSLKAQ